MNKMLVEIYDINSHRMFSEFLDALDESNLNFRTSSLEIIFEDQGEVYLAIKRAMQIFNTCGLPIRNHFKAVYTADISIQSVKVEWKLSKLAYCLVILNGNPDNPVVGKMQVELLKQII